MKSIVFFNNKGGVGKTTLVYHFTWMLSELGYKTVAVDLDPQANLTSMFLEEERLIEIFSNEANRPTILECIKPLTKGLGDIKPATIEYINQNIGLIPGDLDLSMFEDRLSLSWNQAMSGDELAFRMLSSFYRIVEDATSKSNADFAIIDVGPNFGAINRATLISADYIVIPMAADLFSLQGLRNLGSTIEAWNREWEDRFRRNPEPTLNLPEGKMKPLGYVVMQHGIKERRPIKSYLAWANRIPEVYNSSVLKDHNAPKVTVEQDEHCLALLKHYHSLIPMAMEKRKPIFLLKPADGAIGGHLGAVERARIDFKNLTEKVLSLIA